MRRLQFLGLAVLFFSLILVSVTQAFAQEAIAEAVAEASPVEPSKTKVRPLTVSASLVDSSIITGTLLDSTSLSIKTAFGDASIPLSEVAGIRFPNADDSSTTVVMLNGDSITGATDLKFASVETTWGSAKINGQNISSMLFVPGLRWQPVEALGGKRWNLVEATMTPPPQNNNVQQASGVRSNSSQSSGQPPQIIFGR